MIQCKENPSVLYIGATTNLPKRIQQHKTACINPNDKEHRSGKYVMIREHGGWDSFNVVPLRQVRCETRLELAMQEELEREAHNANLNTYRATTGRPAVYDPLARQERYAREKENIAAMRRHHEADIAGYKASKFVSRLRAIQAN
jgi:hypothetical protein